MPSVTSTQIRWSLKYYTMIQTFILVNLCLAPGWMFWTCCSSEWKCLMEAGGQFVLTGTRVWLLQKVQSCGRRRIQFTASELLQPWIWFICGQTQTTALTQDGWRGHVLLTDPLTASLYPGYDKLSFTLEGRLLQLFAWDSLIWILGADNQQTISLKSLVFLLACFLFKLHRQVTANWGSAEVKY